MHGLSRSLRCHHPARRGEGNRWPAYIGLEGGADGFDYPCTGAFIRPLKEQADRSKPANVAGEFRLLKAADDIDRPDVDRGPATRLQNGLDPAPVGEGELPR